MEILTSKFEIHRAIVKVRRKIEFAETFLSHDKSASVAPAIDFAEDHFRQYHAPTNVEIELLKAIMGTREVPEGLYVLESEYLAPLEDAVAALELSEVEEKKVHNLRERMNSVFLNSSLLFKKSKFPQMQDESLILKGIVARAEEEKEENKKIRAFNKRKRWISRTWRYLYQGVLFLGALWVVFHRSVPWLLGI